MSGCPPAVARILGVLVGREGTAVGGSAATGSAGLAVGPGTGVEGRGVSIAAPFGGCAVPARRIRNASAAARRTSAATTAGPRPFLRAGASGGLMEGRAVV